MGYHGESEETPDFLLASGFTRGPFAVGDVVRGMKSGKIGKVTAVNGNGNIKVLYHGESEETPEFLRASGFTRGPFVVGDVVRGMKSEKTGKVTAVNKDGNIKVFYHGESEETPDFKLASGFTKVFDAAAEGLPMPSRVAVTEELDLTIAPFLGPHQLASISDLRFLEAMAEPMKIYGFDSDILLLMALDKLPDVEWKCGAVCRTRRRSSGSTRLAVPSSGAHLLRRQMM